MTNKHRNLTELITTLLTFFPVVAILGARQCGKTTLAQQAGAGWHYIDLEKPSDLRRMSHDVELFFNQYPDHVILDEAQLYPEIFNVLRGVIDQKRGEKGRFIITGSSSPELLTHVSESLAGRIGIVELGTLKTNEFTGQPLSPFYSIFEEDLNPTRLPNGPAPLDARHIHHVWLNGGYPEPLLVDNAIFWNQWMAGYQNTYINRDISHLFPKLNRQAYFRFVHMLSQLSGTIINRQQIGRDIESSESAVRDYLQIAEGTFIWRSLPSYEKSLSKSLVKLPKGYLRDSGLRHYLSNIKKPEQLYSAPNVGLSFESFVIEELIKGLQATLVTHWQPYYYRTRGGAEIDLILDGPFGVLPIEIKYASQIKRNQLTTLSAFIDDHKCRFGLVISSGTHAEWLTPTIFHLPVGWI